MSEIINTCDIAEEEWDGHSEPQDVRSDIVATHEPEQKGMEFHVSLRDYTLHDMEDLIVEAAARMIVGRSSSNKLAKDIEAKVIEKTTALADKALSAVAADIIDQPMLPSFGSKEPVTMREFIGLCGRKYLSQRVDRDGKPSTSGYGTFSRMELIVGKHLDARFKNEIERATNAGLSEIQKSIKAECDTLIAKEKARIRDAIGKATA